MPKLPAVTGAEVVRALKRAGFYFRRQAGSHVILSDPGRRHRVSVPCHSGHTLSRGILHDIIKQAGLTAEEFVRFLD